MRCNRLIPWNHKRKEANRHLLITQRLRGVRYLLIIISTTSVRYLLITQRLRGVWWAKVKGGPEINKGYCTQAGARLDESICNTRNTAFWGLLLRSVLVEGYGVAPAPCLSNIQHALIIFRVAEKGTRALRWAQYLIKQPCEMRQYSLHEVGRQFFSTHCSIWVIRALFMSLLKASPFHAHIIAQNNISFHVT